MRGAYYEVMTTVIKRQHEPPRIVGDLPTAEIAEKHVAEDVTLTDDDVGEIYSYAEFDAPVVGHISIALMHRALNCNGTFDSVNGTGEFDQYFRRQSV